MKNNFKQLLASATLAYVTTFSGLSAAALPSVPGVLGLRTPDFYAEKYSANSSLMSLSNDCKDREDCMGGCFSATVGYQANFQRRGGDELAKTLGHKDKAEFSVSGNKEDVGVETLINTWYPHVATNVTTGDLINPWATNSKAENGNTNGSLGLTKVSTSPRTKAVYGSLCYHHDLSNYFYDGLSFYVSASAVWMRNDLNPKFDKTDDLRVSKNAAAFHATPFYANETQLLAYGIGAGTNATYAVPANGFDSLSNGMQVEDFFTGKSGTANTPNSQKGLRYAQYVNAPSEVNVPDIRMGLKLRVINSENFNASFGVDGSIPTNSSEAESLKYLYSSKVSQNHFKLGLSACGDACLAEGADYKVTALLSTLWHYGFERERFRLLGHTKNNFNMYQLAVRHATVDTDLPVVAEPLINLLMDDATKMKVKPGHSFLLHPVVNIEKGCFVVGVGYNFHYTSEETAIIPQAVTNSTYLLLDSNYAMMKNTSGTGATVNQKLNLTGANRDNLGDVAKVVTSELTASRASVALHYLHLNLGVACKDWQYPAGLAFTLGYEFATNRERNRELFNVGVTGSVCF